MSTHIKNNKSTMINWEQKFHSTLWDRIDARDLARHTDK